MTAEEPENILSNLCTIADLLALCDGMKREDIYYLEQRGYIRPLKQKHGRLERNLFTQKQATLCVTIWRHRQAGLSPRKAYEKALRETNMGQLSLWEEKTQ